MTDRFVSSSTCEETCESRRTLRRIKDELRGWHADRHETAKWRVVNGGLKDRSREQGRVSL